MTGRCVDAVTPGVELRSVGIVLVERPLADASAEAAAVALLLSTLDSMVAQIDSVDSSEPPHPDPAVGTEACDDEGATRKAVESTRVSARLIC